MILLISDKPDNDPAVMRINYSLLCDKPVHLFIASNIWEKLVVEISDDIPADVLKYVILRCKNREAILPARKLSSHEVGLLCEMYPEKSGLIRKAAMLGRDLASVIKEENDCTVTQ